KDYIPKYINENFYAVKFDAQFKEPITFQGVEYKFVNTANGSCHELAAALLKGKLKLPPIVFLDEQPTNIQSLGPDLNAAEMEMILNYYATESYKATPWRKYVKNFTPSEQFNVTVNNGSR